LIGSLSDSEIHKRIRRNILESYVYYGQEKRHFTLPSKWNLLTQGEPSEYEGVPDVKKEIIRALDHPIAAPRIEEIVKPGKTVILFDDLTRPTPAYLVFPEILRRLNAAGVKDNDITAICALGSHPRPTKEQLVEKIGKEAYERLSPRVVIHDSNSEENVIIGRTTYGSLVEANPLVLEAGFCVGIGGCIPHLASGVGGGSKIVMPGVFSFQSILEHHIKWIANSGTVLGRVEGNQFHMEQDEMVRMTGVQYKVDLAMNVKKEVTNVYAGDICEISKVTSQNLLKEYGVPVPGKADVVISGSYPLDRGIQACKGIDPAVYASKPGSHIVLVGRNTLPEQFKPLAPEINNEKSFAREIRDTIGGEVNPIARKAGISAWYIVVYLKMQLERHKITYVCEDMSPSEVEAMGMSYDKTIDDALERIERELPEADVTIFPAGSITVPIME